MFLIDTILLVGGILCLVAIWSSKLSARFGVPVLVLCLAIGMLAGSDGIGGIEFENYSLAHAVGTVALAIILFDGGLRTSFATVRIAWKPAAVLATLGVILTALITGVAASRVLDIPLLHGLLLGSIISSTDAAAVFLILKKQGLRLKERMSAILEIESGSNDPMAVFLTIAVIEILQGQSAGADALKLFVNQMVVGSIVGVAVGLLGIQVINRSSLDTPGLYPLLAGALGMIAFGTAANLQGSGFLAVYLAGIFMGSGRVVFRRGIYMFHDGAAWMAQIAMFVVMGLLVSPKSLLGVAWPGVLVALVLMLVARPLTVGLTMFPFGFSLRELLFLSWVGLKGAVPIILATYPLLFQVEHARLIFDIVFFVVLLSAVVQGWSLPPVADRLGVKEGMISEPYATLEISSLQHLDAEIVEYRITPGSPAADRRISELPLPEGVLIALVARERQVVPPGGGTRLERGDYIFVVLHQDLRPLLDRIFSGAPPSDALLPPHKQFALRGYTTLGELHEFYGVELRGPQDQTLAELLEEALDEPAQEDFVHLDSWVVGVRRKQGEEITWVYLAADPV